MLFADLLSLHLVTFLMFFILVNIRLWSIKLVNMRYFKPISRSSIYFPSCNSSKSFVYNMLNMSLN